MLFDIPVRHITNTRSSPRVVFKRKTRSIEMKEFQISLVNKLNENTPHDLNFHETLSIYNHCLSSTLDDFAPMLPHIVHHDSCTPPVWMDKEYKSQRIIRRRLERAKKKRKTNDTQAQYALQLNHCIFLANRKQKEYWSDIANSTENQGKLFKTVSKLWKQPAKKTLPSHHDSSTLANDFNSFFVNKIKTIREQLSRNPSDQHLYDSSRPPSNSFSTFQPVSMEQLRLIISEMTIKTSFDDPLPASLLKKSIDTLLPYILDIVNLSLETGSIAGLKESVITPIIKKLDLNAEYFANYRPIVNLQFLSKVIEKCVLSQLNNHMSINNLHCDEQFAYRKNHSTETMVLQIVNDVLVGFEKDNCTILVLLDMSAAFDTVDIHKLLKILEFQIGLKGTVLKWFESFLLGREQKVLIEGELSQALVTLYGVPQGSVLGPVLFNIYVRSLPKTIKNLGFSTSIYADDSNARKQFSLNFQYHNSMVSVPDLIDEISNWMRSHFLKINPAKTEIILFTPPSEKHAARINGIFVGDSCIRFSSSVKLLGIQLDSCLNLDGHINNVVSECFYHLRNISKIKRYLTDQQTQKVVHAFVSSKIDYSNSLFYGLKACTLNKLQRVQNYAARIVSSSSSSATTKSLLENLHWLDIKQRTLFKILLLVHKFFMGTAPQYFTDYLLVRCSEKRILHTKFMQTSSG